MNLSWMESISRPVAVFILSALLVAGLFGAFGGMQQGMDGRMGGCPFTVGLSVCNMNVLEHMRAWQSMFLSAPRLFGAFILLAALLIVFFIIFYSILKSLKDNLLFIKERHRLRFYTSFSDRVLQEAFSQGVLNTKIY